MDTMGEAICKEELKSPCTCGCNYGYCAECADDIYNDYNNSLLVSLMESEMSKDKCYSAIGDMIMSAYREGASDGMEEGGADDFPGCSSELIDTMYEKSITSRLFLEAWKNQEKA